jgi:tRNA dimethylallyltransferase
VCIESGRALSSFVLPQQVRTEWDFSTVIITRPREELYARIDARVESMFESGLKDEVAGLILAGYGKDDPGMRAIGYREFFTPEVLGAAGQEKTAIAKELIKRDTRRYAKRQETYMKGIPNAVCVNADDFESVTRAVAGLLQSQDCRR